MGANSRRRVVRTLAVALGFGALVALIPANAEARPATGAATATFSASTITTQPNDWWW